LFDDVRESAMLTEYGGLWGLLVLIADIWAIVNIIQSSASTGKKVLWIVVVAVLPVLGFILWLFIGPKTGKS
jgi:Phospholipase_D-nuclease N-terminal